MNTTVKLDGVSLTRDLRAKLSTPILLLTAKGEISDKLSKATLELVALEEKKMVAKVKLADAF